MLSFKPYTLHSQIKDCMIKVDIIKLFMVQFIYTGSDCHFLGCHELCQRKLHTYTGAGDDVLCIECYLVIIWPANISVTPITRNRNNSRGWPLVGSVLFTVTVRASQRVHELNLWYEPLIRDSRSVDIKSSHLSHFKLGKYQDIDGRN